LVPELQDLEMYLRQEGRKDVIEELDETIKMCDTFYSASGVLFKLVGVLRAADIFWSPNRSAVLFHMEGEPLEGGEPRLLIRSDKDG